MKVCKNRIPNETLSVNRFQKKLFFWEKIQDFSMIKFLDHGKLLEIGSYDIRNI
jgi:hypothetical protein